MKDVKKWVQKYQSLKPKQQLEIAETIMNELNYNEYNLDDKKYDKKKSMLVKQAFHHYIAKTKEKKELQELKEILDRFDDLPDKERKDFIECVYKNLLKALYSLEAKKQRDKKRKEQLEKKAFCKANGHTYSSWEERVKPILVQNSDNQTVSHEKTYWQRSCSCCGHIQKTTKKPMELKEKTIQKK